MARFKVEVDRIVCQGFGACVKLCPRYFSLSDTDGKTSIQEAEKTTTKDEVVKELLETDDLDCLKEAAEACPFNAIHVMDTKTGDEPV